MATRTVPRISEDEYLRRERVAEFKSEYVDGEVFAMAGGSLRHSLLAGNWTVELGSKARGSKCRVFTSDARIRTAVSGAFVYPDVSIVCGEPGLHQGAADTLTNPVAVIEVLSPSTADYDRGRKFELYREISPLQEYILTHAETAHIEHYARQSDGSWIFREYRGTQGSLRLSTLGWDIALADIYAGVLELPN